MSTMANTLILVYAGASLPLFLFFTTLTINFLYPNKEAPPNLSLRENLKYTQKNSKDSKLACS